MRPQGLAAEIGRFRYPPSAGPWAAESLSRPGEDKRARWRWPAAPVIGISAVAIGQPMGAPDATRASLVLGESALTCTAWIAIGSLPPMVALIRVMRGQAPTRPWLAGAVAEVTRHMAATNFHFVTPTCVRIMLAEVGSRLLATFPEGLGEAAREERPWRASARGAGPQSVPGLPAWLIWSTAAPAIRQLPIVAPAPSLSPAGLRAGRESSMRGTPWPMKATA